MKAIDDNTAILAIPNVHWCDGSLIDLEAIRAGLDAIPAGKRPQLVVDGTQSVGVLPLDVQKVRPLFLACSVHKWLNAPYGMSLMYLDPSCHLHWLPIDQVRLAYCLLWNFSFQKINNDSLNCLAIDADCHSELILIMNLQHERNREGSDQPAWDEQVPFHDRSGFPTAFFPGARRIDSGGSPNPVTIASLHTSLTLTLRWGPDRLQTHIRALSDTLAEKLTSYLEDKVVLLSPGERCGHILGVRLADKERDLHSLMVALQSHGVFVSVRGGCVRVSLYVFNTLLEVRRFAALFAQLVLFPDSQDTLTAQALSEKRAEDGRLRVLVTGCNGWLGQFLWDALLARSAEEDLDLFAAHHGETYPSWVARGRRLRMNLTNAESVQTALRTVRPHVVVHLAAISSPAVCHKDSAAAMAANCPAALTDVLQSEFPHCLLLFSSTDMVPDPYGFFNP